jgi:type IV secretion system protein VirB4
MLSIRRITKSYRDAGALHTLLNMATFLDDAVFLTKSGDLGMCVAWKGVDYDGLGPEERDAIARRFERSLRLFDERYRLYQYLLKTPVTRLDEATTGIDAVDALLQARRDFVLATRPLFTVQTYAAVVFEGWREHAGGGLWAQLRTRGSRLVDAWSPEPTTDALAASLQQARDTLRRQVDGWVSQLRDLLHARTLDKAETFVLLHRLVNYAPDAIDRVRLRQDTWLDDQLADAAVECHRTHLRVDEAYVRVLTLKTPPPQTYAHLLQALYELPAPFIAALEWRREAPGPTRRLLQSKRRHFHNSRISALNYVVDQQPSAAELLVDDSATALVQDLGHALERMEMQGQYFGECSLTLVLPDTDPLALQRTVSACQKALALHNAVLLEERYNLLHAWLAILPGHGHFNLRRMYLSNTNYADLSWLFGLDDGEPVNAHLQQPALVVFETAHQTPFFLNLHVADVGHTLLLGATGSGKSFLISLLLAHAQRYRPRVTLFDLGGSYARLIRHFDGQSLRLGLTDQPCTINPFAAPPTTQHLQFLFTFVRLLIESGGQYAPTTADDRDLYEQIANLYELAPEQRRLGTLARVLRRGLGDQLQRWVDGGPYGAMFDHADDTLSFAPFQLVDLQGLDRYPQVLEPLLFYLLQRASLAVHDPALADTWKLFVVDEAWRFLRHPRIQAHVTQALKTWRKRNGAVWLATQSSEDLATSGMLRVAVESCPSWLFMANPSFDRAAYRDVFHLSDATLDQIATLISRHEVLLQQPGRTKVLTLTVDPLSESVYRTNPIVTTEPSSSLTEVSA